MPGGRIAHRVYTIAIFGEAVKAVACDGVMPRTGKTRKPGNAKRCAKCAKMRKS